MKKWILLAVVAAFAAGCPSQAQIDEWLRNHPPCTGTATSTDTSTDTGVSYATEITVAQEPSTTVLMNGEITAYAWSVTTSASGAAAARRFTLLEQIDYVEVTNRRLVVDGTTLDPALYKMTLAPGDKLAIEFTGEQIVTAGQTRTYELKEVVTASGLRDDAMLTYQLLGDENILPLQTLDGLDDQNFVWSDMSALPHSLESADWTNGHDVTGLPTPVSAIAKP